MTIELRELAPEHWDTLYNRLERAFGGPTDPLEERAQWRRVTEFDRTLAAWDGPEMVGTAGAFTFSMTVPGGIPLTVPGVTMVSVQPTHRRRGLLTSMMRRQFDEFHGRGEPVAVLTASEPAIYGRFGYGVGSKQLHGTVDTVRTSFRRPAGVERVRFRLVSAAEGLAACEAVYARLVPGRPGMLARRPGWETRAALDPPSGRNGTGPLHCLLAEVDGEVRGYARYAVTGEWSSAGADETVRLRDVEALDPVTYAALWDFLASIDLTSRIHFTNRPADDPLQHLVSDVRRCQLGFRDGLHVRLVDVGAALAARTYSAPVDVVLDVGDAFCPWNSGRWRLTGDIKGAVCERTSEPAELRLSVKELGAAYLGGFGLAAMAGAGLVREERTGALAEASTAFRTDPEPWLPHGF
ncbi:Predicted acetyltransferase [Streptomyces sp. DvalAA-14]|uniref:GNAT family N-acetyltransferase n=1 Tax=unclassified Streptomyces TaxID=2593676 RepID=UPI00081B1A77|nr:MULTISPECIES: GNAT family N-acetyltransferase [unclassified Streptomyces]MYS24740.1 GNAT family N-acetyltransferase [Streptomyces sp. SID4948]SCE48952.1 Predicted acetyltransferase [Streptomyces sp. DvalAA-14]